jgi:hypothetical protein
MKGRPPQSHGGDCSSSRSGATVEDLNHLRPSSSQLCCSNWSVFGRDGADTYVERISSVLWRRNRLLLLGFLLGSGCKVVGSGCIFLYFLNLAVIAYCCVIFVTVDNFYQV